MGVQIFVRGLGMVDSECYAVHKAVNEYDARLSFERHPVFGDYCVFMKMPHGQDPLPVFNYGQSIPHHEDAVKRLHQADAVRRGEEILDNMNQHNEELRVQSALPAEHAEWELAEAMESAFHRENKTNYFRSLPKKDPKQRSAK